MSIMKFEQHSQEKSLLILDVDETLVSAVNKAYLHGVYNYPHDFKVLNDEYYVTKRDHLDEFLKYAFENWNVAVWTAATRGYATEILTKSGIDINRLEFFKVQEDCVSSNDEGFDKLYIKDLNDISDSYDLARVLLVDDKKGSAKRTPDNLIEMYAWISYMKNDDYLLKLIDYLEEIKNAPDFRSIDKSNWYK